MDRISLETLLAPCSANGSVGQNLEYDSRYVSMLEFAEGTPEMEYGSTLVAAQEPDWKKLYEISSELSIETRDLRVAVMLTESLCRLRGWEGLADGLRLASGWTSQFWSEIYPQLDPADGDDPIERIGALSRLWHPDYLVHSITQLPLATDAALGVVTLRDLRNTQPSAESNTKLLTRPEIEAIFLSASKDALAATQKLIHQALSAAEQLANFLRDQVGAGQVDTTLLLATLRDCGSAVENACSRRGGAALRGPSLTSATPLTAQEAPKAAQLKVDENEEVAAGAVPATAPMRIENRADAMEVLDSLCAYFQKYEPASPVPLLLQRAKRLIPMSFVDILRELAPDGLSQAMQSVGAVSRD